MSSDHKTSTYEAPALRTLGSVHELTRGLLTGGGADGVLLSVRVSVSNGS